MFMISSDFGSVLHPEQHEATLDVRKLGNNLTNQQNQNLQQNHEKLLPGFWFLVGLHLEVTLVGQSWYGAGVTAGVPQDDDDYSPS